LTRRAISAVLQQQQPDGPTGMAQSVLRNCRRLSDLDFY